MLMVCHHLDSVDPGGPRLRREPHPQGDHRGRGHPARPRRALDDVVRLAGDGPRRRSHHPHLADRRQDEGAARRAAGRDAAQRQLRACKRYVAKYTINPAIAHGVSQHVGSVEAGQARRPRAVDAGLLRREARSDRSRAASSPRRRWAIPNASIPTPQPVHYRPMFGAYRPGAIASTSLTFVSQARDRQGTGGDSCGVHKPLVAVENTRGGIAQERHDPQRRHAAHRGRSRDL